MPIVLYYPKCTTCKKALNWLEQQGISCELRDIQKNPPSFDELRLWYNRSGLPLKRFFNTSGILYRQLELKNKLPSMAEEKQLKLLSTDGMLVKRPLLVTEAGAFPGFREAEWLKLLK